MNAASDCLPILVTGSADKTLRIWQNHDRSDISAYQLSQIVEDHKASINCVAVLPEANLLVSGSADATVRVWEFVRSLNVVEIQLLHTVVLKPHFFPLAVAVALLKGPEGGTSGRDVGFILAVAGTWTGIQVYVADRGKVNHSATLTGHEGWIRGLSFVRETDVTSDLLLASASQDKYIRLWRVHRGEELPAVSSAAQDPALGVLGRSLSNKAHRFSYNDEKYSVTFEALLLGHEDWIYTTQWYKDPTSLAVRLLTASADNSLAVWAPDEASGIWTSIARLGEISAQKGSTSATGSTGGFWIGLWSPSGDAVISLGRSGSWRLWRYNQEKDTWQQDIAVTGHVKEIRSLNWAPDGSYLLTTSSDQTTRLWAEWKREKYSSWHEFSRPQIHGYDLNTIDSLTMTRFVSGADEKLLRVFDMPTSVASLLATQCGIETRTGDLPEAANIPVLGLSNKAVTSAESTAAVDGADEEEAEQAVQNPIETLDRPPFEDHLARHMLWPEIEKLYGHGYEISTLAASHDGKLIATACRASSIDHAVIRLYETEEWRELKPALQAHSLTVTGMQFSHDDKYLLSVGRDRQFAIWRRAANESQAFELAFSNAKAHSRMVLGCSWATISHKSEALKYVFATAGRDKAVKIWLLQGDQAATTTTIQAPLPVTAVAFHSNSPPDHLILAYALEDGLIFVTTLLRDGLTVLDSIKIERPDSTKPDGGQHGVAGGPPSKLVTSVAWRPLASQPQHDHSDQPQKNTYQLAVGSDDTSVRVYNIRLNV